MVLLQSNISHNANSFRNVSLIHGACLLSVSEATKSGISELFEKK